MCNMPSKEILLIALYLHLWCALYCHIQLFITFPQFIDFSVFVTVLQLQSLDLLHENVVTFILTCLTSLKDRSLHTILEDERFQGDTPLSMCGPKEYGFLAILVINRVSSLAISVSNRYGFSTLVLNRSPS